MWNVICPKNRTSTCTCENGKYLGSIIGDSLITYDEILKLIKTVPTKTNESKTVTTSFNKMKVTCKMKNFYILLVFLLTSIYLLIAVSIYYCFIKHRSKQKHLFLY